MLLPGCGGSVAMLGCLAGHTVSRVSEKPSRIDIALYVAGSMSRGSAISASENLTAECLQVVDGELVPQEEEEASSTLQLDFDNGAGPVTNYPVTLPDLITLRRSTAVPNIRTFVHAAGDAFPSGGNLAALPDGPTAEQRDAAPYHAAVLVTAADGSVKRSVLHTVNGYTFTGKASAEAAGKVLAGVVRAGFQTPAEVFGRRFVEVVEGSNVVDF
ncbi:hypothetical protein BJY01DRAFT_203246 [Aspergillus pseudoustus]|uniref:Saccharopine dehydrogenase-domain-containing protein n=1 Tax=Aspergillus pseudoustus TaxID=1810923 RepID=A0ABR4KWM2_9EURO